MLQAAAENSISPESIMQSKRFIGVAPFLVCQ
jgi:hypothetical protein